MVLELISIGIKYFIVHFAHFISMCFLNYNFGLFSYFSTLLATIPFKPTFTIF